MISRRGFLFGLSAGAAAISSAGAIPRSARQILLARHSITIPAGLGWNPPFTIKKTGSVYTIANFDFDALKPTPDYIYYVSPTGSAAASPASDDPNTPINGNRFRALANTNGGIVEGRCAAGIYNGNIGLNGSNITCSGIVLSLWAGQQGSSRPIMVQRGVTNAAPVFTLDQGTTYKTAHASASTPVFDLLYRDATTGIPPRLTTAADLATCRTTPGSEFYDGSALKYVNAQDGRSLVGDLNMIVEVAGNIFNTSRAVSGTIWVDGLDFFGGAPVAQTGAAQTTNFYHRNCGWFGGQLGTTGPVNVYAISPRTSGSNTDGLNYHGNGVGDAKFLEYDVRSARNGFAGATNNNCSTAHENCIGILVAGNYAGSEGPTVHDINSAKRFMVGCAISPSVLAGSGGTHQAVTMKSGLSGGTASKIWLDDCTFPGGHSADEDLYADTGCSILYRNMSIAGLTTGGTGTITPF